MKKSTRKKRVLGATLVLSAGLLLAATYAWFSSTDNVTNKFTTGALPDGSVKIWEIFEEPTAWLPGEEVEKQVGVINNSEGDVVVRLAYKEAMTKLEADGTNLKKYVFPTKQTGSEYVPAPSVDYSVTGDYKELSILGLTVDGSLPDGVKLLGKRIAEDASGQTKYAFVIYEKDGDNFHSIAADISMNDAGTVVSVKDVQYVYYKPTAEVTKDWAQAKPAGTNTSAIDDKLLFTYNSLTNTPTAENWVYGEDGWFYYIGKLSTGEVSPILLSSVTLHSSADNTYQLMNYSLDVRIEALQATPEAINEGGFPGIPDAIKQAMIDAL
ncbi:BsaA family SipW-dependent biofilm matrix protein [Vagococcus acidifermentans]|uniref:Alternate signal-mediated exported protein n=1 Tax=Vagococcus acidifermentans TaxID=564710 RepID=A0A430AVL2_9ENTE|nr:BsaA family SipW-dependent biofilm matrix protein [Vagococcus acidifermentans]RSU12089.1 hypothetical protein CBF27_06595 [Vagococcus acidifermentans]